MQNITLDSQVKRKQSIFFSETDNEAVMLSIEQGKYFGTNPMGTKIWSLLEHQTPVTSLIASLQADYDVTKTQCEQEVMQFLQTLAENDLVDVM